MKQYPKLRRKPEFESRVPKGIGKGVADSIARWAAEHPKIRRVWVYGSRAKGTYRPDSDVDVAVELEPAGDSEETLAAWMANAGVWRWQLQGRISAPVDLEWFDPDCSSTALDEAKVLVYERAS